MTKKMDVKEAAVQVEDVIDALIKSARETAPLPPIRSAYTTRDPLPGMQTLSRNELASLYALLAYTAHEQQLQETVQAIVEAQFGVRHISAMRGNDFERAVSFIAGLRVDQRIN